jgi:hypothetical protein
MSKIDNSNKKFRKACSHGYTSVIEDYLHSKNIDPGSNGNKSIIKASLFDHQEIVNLLIADPRVDVSVRNNIVVRNLCHNLNFDSLYKLLKIHIDKIDPVTGFNKPIRYASAYGHIKIVRLLLADPRVDPTDLNNDALTRASENGHTKIVKLLTKHKLEDISVKASLLAAFHNNHYPVVQILLRKSFIKMKHAAKLLEEASAKGYVEIVDMLLKYIYVKSESKLIKYFDVDAESIEKIYPVHSVTIAIYEAITHGHKNVMKSITIDEGYIKYRDYIINEMSKIKKERTVRKVNLKTIKLKKMHKKIE